MSKFLKALSLFVFVGATCVANEVVQVEEEETVRTEAVEEVEETA